MTDIERAAQAGAAWWADRLEVVDKREAFREALVPILAEVFASGITSALLAGISVDHDPGPRLLEALRAAGIPCRGHGFSVIGILPRKTAMRLGPLALEGRLGRPGETWPTIPWHPIWIRSGHTLAEWFAAAAKAARESAESARAMLGADGGADDAELQRSIGVHEGEALAYAVAERAVQGIGPNGGG